MNKWFESRGGHADIAVTSRVRLARNLRDVPFAGRMTRAQESDVLSSVSAAIMNKTSAGADFALVETIKTPRAELGSMVEKHLISPALARENTRCSGALLSSDEGVSVMINEEDHIRLQVMGTGLCLDSCLDYAQQLDRLLDESLDYAFSPELGYLTRCPTNLGTGLRASVMLHLPALTLSGSLERLISAAGQLGIAIRGFYGEGSSALGGYFQVSNSFTLGVTEREITGRVGEVVVEIIGEEKKRRSELASVRSKLEDRVYRALGTLTHARLIGSDEAMSLLGDIRLGVSMGILNNIDYETQNKLLWEIQPATVALAAGTGKAADGRDRLRADLLRSRLKEVQET